MINNTSDMPTGLAARRKLCPNFKLCPRKNLEKKTLENLEIPLNREILENLENNKKKQKKQKI